jgi:hypothetical protein
MNNNNNNSNSTASSSISSPPYYSQQATYKPTKSYSSEQPWSESKEDLEDSNRKGKKRKEMNSLMKELNQDYLNKYER